MNVYLKLGVAVVVAFVTWYATSDHYQKEIAEMKVEALSAAQADRALAAAKTKKAGEQHAKDQLTITSLNDAVVRMQRTHIPVCGGSQTSADRDRKARVLSERVDAAFAKLREGVRERFNRCEQLNNDAIQSNEAQ